MLSSNFFDRAMSTSILEIFQLKQAANVKYVFRNPLSAALSIPPKTRIFLFCIRKAYPQLFGKDHLLEAVTIDDLRCIGGGAFADEFVFGKVTEPQNKLKDCPLMTSSNQWNSDCLPTMLADEALILFFRQLVFIQVKKHGGCIDITKDHATFDSCFSDLTILNSKAKHTRTYLDLCQGWQQLQPNNTPVDSFAVCVSFVSNMLMSR